MSNQGKTVKVHYTGTLDDGEKFDSSYDHGEPLEFVVGQGLVIEGFENAVREMAVGETVNIHLEPAEAYGEYDPEAIEQANVTDIPNGNMLPVGKRIIMEEEGGYAMPLIVSIEDGVVTFDFNHPMAGKALNFELTLVEVSE